MLFDRNKSVVLSVQIYQFRSHLFKHLFHRFSMISTEKAKQVIGLIMGL